MRDRQKTIDALRRLAERPGSPAEGETARRKLRELEAQMPPAAPASKIFGSEWPWDRPVPPNVRRQYEKNEAEFKANLADFFRGAGYVPRPKAPVISWEGMEGVIRRNIYRRGQGDAD